jgi:hypothetical protein
VTDKTEQAIRDAEQAKALLEHPMFVAAWEAIAQEIDEGWRNSPPRDAEGREMLFLTRRLLDKLQSHFVAHVENGKIAADNLAALELSRTVNGR